MAAASPAAPAPRVATDTDAPGRPPTRRFALISDVHVFDRDGIWSERINDFTLHRLLGLANIVVMRGPGKYSTRVLAAALEDMHAQGVEHLVCAGDVTNLAMECEFAMASDIFGKFGPPETMSFCPGNHDIYVQMQSEGQLFKQYFGKYCKSDVPARSPRNDGFPYLHLRGGIAFLGLNTGCPNTAAGEAGVAQWAAARAMLGTPQAHALLEAATFRVIIQHHPAQDPDVRGTTRVRQVGHGFKDWRELRDFSRDHSFDLVVHGHLHRPYRAALAGAPGTLVYESGSGTLMTNDKERVARYTVFDLTDDGRKLKRTYSRVWNEHRNKFDTRELPVPNISTQVNAS
jgi:3',5'-cyclic AMP phosphodiesterase CpdA